MCHIDGPHFHAFKPHQPLLYVQVDDSWAFIGDPTEFEPEEPKYAYYGHHPAFWVDGDGPEVAHYCYISGPHYHLYAPPRRLKFEARGGVNWYVGVHPAWYATRYRRHRHIDRYYASIHLAHPVVTVEPPEGYVGFVIGPSGRARVHGRVHGDLHRVAPPPPGINVDIRIPGVGVMFGGGPRRGVVYHDGRRGKHKHHGPPSHAPAWGRRGHGRKGKRK